MYVNNWQEYQEVSRINMALWEFKSLQSNDKSGSGGPKTQHHKLIDRRKVHFLCYHFEFLVFALCVTPNSVTFLFVFFLYIVIIIPLVKIPFIVYLAHCVSILSWSVHCACFLIRVSNPAWTFHVIVVWHCFHVRVFSWNMLNLQVGPKPLLSWCFLNRCLFVCVCVCVFIK